MRKRKSNIILIIMTTFWILVFVNGADVHSENTRHLQNFWK